MADVDTETQALFAAASAALALAKTPGVTYDAASGCFGGEVLKLHGHAFAMISSHRRLAFTLPQARIDALVASGAGKLFQPDGGGPVDGWVEVQSNSAQELVALGLEALAFVRT
jgi:hypothetical protein